MKVSHLFLFSSLVFSSFACGGQKDSSSEAAAADSTAQSASEVQSDPVRENRSEVKMGGKDYVVTVTREPDQEGGTVQDEVGTLWKDNVVRISVTAAGEEVISRTFHKSDFADKLTEAEASGTILLGMAYDETASVSGRVLRFGAQVGQPGIGEGPAFTVELSLDGSVRIVRDSNQDTTGDDGMEE